jgi:DNA primase
LKIEEVVGRKYPLRRKGKYMVPKAGEPSSLVVDVEAQLFNWNARGIHGNVRTWLRMVEGKEESEIAGICGSIEETRESMEPDEPLDPKLALRYHRSLFRVPAAQEELSSRGITKTGAIQFRLGHSPAYGGSIAIPHFLHGELIGIKLRVIGGKGDTRYRAEPGSRFIIYNYDDSYSIIVEGEFKAISLWQAGIDAMSLPAGRFMSKAAEMLTGASYIYIRDNDLAGLFSGMQAVYHLGKRVTVISTPSEKAVDDFLLKYGETPWLHQLKKRLRSLTPHANEHRRP